MEAERQEKARQDANNAAVEMEVDGANREGPDSTLALTDREVKSPVEDHMDTDVSKAAAPVVAEQLPPSGSTRDEAPVASGSGSIHTSATPPPEQEPFVVSQGSYDSMGRFSVFTTTTGYDEVTEYQNRGFCWDSGRNTCLRRHQEWQWFCCRDCKHYNGEHHTAECDRLYALSQAADTLRREEVRTAIAAASNMLDRQISGSAAR